MKYKDFEILAETKSYSLWNLDNNGELKELVHDFEGNDVIAYTIVNDKYNIFAGDFEYKTIQGALDAIEVIAKEHKEQERIKK